MTNFLQRASQANPLRFALAAQSILWRRIDEPGHEAASLLAAGSEWHLTGTSVFGHQGLPCRLNYEVRCNSDWQTLFGSVEGWLGDRKIKIEVSADGERRWQLNGAECPQVAGCIDLDLNFSPSTNLLPIRRLGLSVGQAADVTAAWLRFPSFALEPLLQRYTRLGESLYKYESAGGSFTRELRVNEAGFVTEYPGLWVEETLEQGE